MYKLAERWLISYTHNKSVFTMSFMPVKDISTFTHYTIVEAFLIIDSWTGLMHDRYIF